MCQSSATLICDFGRHFSDEVIGFNHQFQVLILQIMVPTGVKKGAVYTLELRMQSPSVSQSHRCLACDTWAQKTDADYNNAQSGASYWDFTNHCVTSRLLFLSFIYFYDFQTCIPGGPAGVNTNI